MPAHRKTAIKNVRSASGRPGSRCKRVWPQNYRRSFCMFSVQRSALSLILFGATSVWALIVDAVGTRFTYTARTHSQANAKHYIHFGYIHRNNSCAKLLRTPSRRSKYVCICICNWSNSDNNTKRRGAARTFMSKTTRSTSCLCLCLCYNVRTCCLLGINWIFGVGIWHLANIAVASQRPEPKTATAAAQSKTQNRAVQSGNRNNSDR